MVSPVPAEPTCKLIGYCVLSWWSEYLIFHWSDLNFELKQLLKPHGWNQLAVQHHRGGGLQTTSVHICPHLSSSAPAAGRWAWPVTCYQVPAWPADVCGAFHAAAAAARSHGDNCWGRNIYLVHLNINRCKLVFKPGSYVILQLVTCQRSFLRRGNTVRLLKDAEQQVTFCYASWLTSLSVFKLTKVHTGMCNICVLPALLMLLASS